jgi:hypothetical protein
MAFYCPHAEFPAMGVSNMNETTCAACDCKIEGESIQVSVGGKTVEVCCEECALTLREAQVSVEVSRGSQK